MQSLEKCLELIRNGQLKAGMELLGRLVRDSDTDLRNSVVQLMARFRRLDRERGMGIVRDGEWSIEWNQITYHAIDLIETIRSDGGFRLPAVSDPPDDGAPKTRLLFVAASPDDAARLHLDVELREIEAVLQGATYRDRFELHKVGATRPADLVAALLRIKPQFFHFSGHGHKEGIWLLDDDHQAKAVSNEALGGMFRLFQPYVGCAFLNACFSSQAAVTIREFVPCVIGSTAAIDDAVAIQYSTRFYQAIGEGETVEYAFEFAKMAGEVNGMYGELRIEN